MGVIKEKYPGAQVQTDDWIKWQALKYSPVYISSVDTIYNPDVDQICYGRTMAYLRRAMCGGYWGDVTHTGSRTIAPYNATNRQISSADFATRGCRKREISWGDMD